MIGSIFACLDIRIPADNYRRSGGGVVIANTYESRSKRNMIFPLQWGHLYSRITG
jgi:hypothetical protein